jgi:hypothetical protein
MSNDQRRQGLETAVVALGAEVADLEGRLEAFDFVRLQIHKIACVSISPELARQLELQREERGKPDALTAVYAMRDEIRRLRECLRKLGYQVEGFNG